ncbi:DnaJ domain-containing protein [Paenibacillus sp. LPE1-1-1.1]|uniref:DnaJ domain-containing protein n=1 Tax=Paenibacillus sp. LPE1-1-1.1 TaxID=3135230 RepID=UPI0034133038
MTQTKRQSNVFSTDLPTIEAEICNYLGTIDTADIATGRAVIEIGKRLTFVKVSHTKHGEWTPWLSRIGIEKRTAQRYMKVADMFGKPTLMSHLAATKLFEMTKLPAAIDPVVFVQAEQVVPSTGEIKLVESMTIVELRDVIRSYRECADLVKPKQKEKDPPASRVSTNPFEALTIDQDKRDILYGLPLAVALRVAKLESVVMNSMLNVASKLSGRIFTEHYTDILADVDGGKKASEIVRTYKKPANRQPLSGLTIDPYEILGVWDGDNDADVRRKYRALVQKVHPDTGGSELLFKIVNAAWEAYKSDY